MIDLLEKYSNKLVDQGLCNNNAPLLGGLDAEIIWNKDSKYKDIFKEVIKKLSINSILFSKPAEPYASIIDFLISENKNKTESIFPNDTETRTFLHDIPMLDELDSKKIIEKLKKRKAVIISGYGIVSYGVVSPEQAFISYSSVCFACYVKFFVNYYKKSFLNQLTNKEKEIFNYSIKSYRKFLNNHKTYKLKKGPFNKKEDIFLEIKKAGKAVVECGLVDSFFGNVSYYFNDTIYISETSSSLDELSGCIDACPIDNSSCAAITASSELTAHKEIYKSFNYKAILHGHPKFAVIMSMICNNEDSCPEKGNCHLKCPYERYINDTPIVSGEVGTGKFGLCNTLPLVLSNKRGAIVYGHGVFAIGKEDIYEAFNHLYDIEIMCINEYIDLINS